MRLPSNPNSKPNPNPNPTLPPHPLKPLTFPRATAARGTIDPLALNRHPRKDPCGYPLARTLTPTLILRFPPTP